MQPAGQKFDMLVLQNLSSGVQGNVLEKSISALFVRMEVESNKIIQVKGNELILLSTWTNLKNNEIESEHFV